ncbi:MAG: ABC transporter permease [Nitrospirae bacterium]|nr:ABC transporter permease [Nitrospirota bacterium]MBI5695360.1 ABC transporter permease [Nitrospirota bacterium]
MTTLRHNAKAVYVITFREFKKFVRERSRLLGTMARPILWLFVVGGGLSRMVQPEGGVSYLQFIFPGMIGMTILFASIFSAISIVWDREFGFLKEILVAPISRFSVVFGKAVAGTCISLVQVLIMVVFIPVLGIHITLAQFFLLIFSAGMLAFSLTSFGILVASRMSSYEGFNIIMNFIVMPMFFLSGAMYPVGKLPPVLKELTHFNPLTYGVDALKNVLLSGAAGTSMGPEYPLVFDLSIIAAFMAVAVVLANWSFRKAG